jgi:hypothetical protein
MLNDKLQIEHIDEAIAVEVGFRIESGLSDLSAERGPDSAYVGTVDGSIVIDIAGSSRDDKRKGGHVRTEAVRTKTVDGEAVTARRRR